MKKDLTLWLAEGKFGVMVHYLITPPGKTAKQRSAEFNRTVDAFDLAGFIHPARAGNTEAICAFNDGVFCAGIVAPLTRLEDY